MYHNFTFNIKFPYEKNSCFKTTKHTCILLFTYPCRANAINYNTSINNVAYSRHKRTNLLLLVSISNAHKAIVKNKIRTIPLQ